MPIVIGTAGHIDHGKTALVHALTGQDTDRLKEEKARGISIDLGFAWLDGPSGACAGVIDVPGHERFVRNMLAGAHGVDLVLFVVAADDGVMPQTEEHLDILHLLGVSRGIFVITKTDLVDADRVAAVREEIEILALDSTLEGAPVVAVSTVTGEGLDALRAEVARQLAAPGRPPRPGLFRLPVDRAFVMRGHGVVVTGTAVTGTVRDGDSVRILPGEKTARVRNLQVHGSSVAEAGHGQRVAMNLAGVALEDVGRGHVVCDPRFDRTTRRFDAFVEMRPRVHHPLATHARVRLHVGTAEVTGRMILLDGRPELGARARAWAQLVLAEPVLALRGDRFILRDETARWTLGGGVVVHPFADRHRGGEAGLVDRLTMLRDGDTVAAVRALLTLAADFACERSAITRALDLDDDAVEQARRGVDDLIPIPDGAVPEAYTTTDKWEGLAARVLGAVRAAHEAAPLDAGVDLERLRSGTAPGVPTKTFRWCVDRLAADRHLVRDENLVRLPDHHVALGETARALAGRLEQLLADGRFTPPDVRQLGESTTIDRRRLTEVLGVLEKEGRVVRVAPDLYFARGAADEATRLLAEHCRAHGEISAATLRDLLGASRKFAIAFLDWCDRVGITTRVGDARRLRR